MDLTLPYGHFKHRNKTFSILLVTFQIHTIFIDEKRLNRNDQPWNVHNYLFIRTLKL
jgi:hypothetical protein